MSEEELQQILSTSFDKDSDMEEIPLADRTSSEFRKGDIEGRITRSKAKEENDPLTQAIKEAVHLEESIKERYIYLAGLYISQMEMNLFRNQFDLHNAYNDVSIDEWNNFLADKIVSVYVQKHKRTLLKAVAEENLSDPTSRNKRDSLQLIKNIEEQEESENNRNIVIMRIPDIYTD